ncbi:zf-HC2 domain-containing protein [Winogradskyella flava]|uniref:Zf-HC2 domain-containing protein n=1 Tax=Winogradskyella flava TaxID=1884876 RepID=A0A842IRR7_9FLAO|nr:zf-HC2 domain-containing protein [Winogradskyella flava]MBC2845435.1 zf-HC2 domain-containing protein [Winogradskyella flava]
MNCKEIKYLITYYQDNNLDYVSKTLVEEHIKSCSSCTQIHQEFIYLIDTINQIQEELPDNDLELAFNDMLAKEKEVLKISKSRVLKPKNKLLKSILKVAAALLLMISSYLFGSYKRNTSQINEIAILRQEKTKMLTIATLSLMENESASKRIQAVKYSQELENPDDEILNALINEMLYDKLVNVRLAAARALERFSENNMVKNAYIQALRTEENTSMQIELIEILAYIKEMRAIPKMKELLNDENTPIFIKDQLKSELKNLI